MKAILFGSSEPVSYAVAGEPHNFYPLSTRALTKLRGIARPVIQAYMSLVTGMDDLITKKVEEQRGADDSIRRVTELGAVSTELFKERLSSRQSQVSVIVETILSDPSARILAEIITLSMRDDFEKKTRTSAELDEILDNIPANALVDILKGIMEANRGWLGPLMERATPEKVALQAVPPSGQPEE